MAEMVGGESSGPATGRGDQDEIHHHVVDDVVGQDGPLIPFISNGPLIS